jgi:hypothetical protein
MLSSLHALSLILILMMYQSVDAFHQAALGREFKSRLPTTIGMAWSLQTPEIIFPKSTWYDDVGYPTFRRRVYDEYVLKVMALPSMISCEGFMNRLSFMVRVTHAYIRLFAGSCILQ